MQSEICADMQTQKFGQHFATALLWLPSWKQEEILPLAEIECGLLSGLHPRHCHRALPLAASRSELPADTTSLTT